MSVAVIPSRLYLPDGCHKSTNEISKRTKKSCQPIRTKHKKPGYSVNILLLYMKCIVLSGVNILDAEVSGTKSTQRSKSLMMLKPQQHLEYKEEL